MGKDDACRRQTASVIGLKKETRTAPSRNRIPQDGGYNSWRKCHRAAVRSAHSQRISVRNRQSPPFSWSVDHVHGEYDQRSGLYCNGSSNFWQKYSPVGTLLGSLLFSMADAITRTAQTSGFPSMLIDMISYIVTVITLWIVAVFEIRKIKTYKAM